MFELIGLGITLGAAAYGHFKSRDFVKRRLRYTDVVRRPGLGIVAGVGAAVVAAPFTLLPLIGTGTAVLFGAGVGTGVALGAKEVRDDQPA